MRIKIAQEGASGRQPHFLLLPNAIVWDEEPLSVYLGPEAYRCPDGLITDIRRVGVGEIMGDIKLFSTAPFAFDGDFVNDKMAKDLLEMTNPSAFFEVEEYASTDERYFRVVKRARLRGIHVLMNGANPGAYV